LRETKAFESQDISKEGTANVGQVFLLLLYADRFALTGFHATSATDTLAHLDGNGLVLLHLKHLQTTDIHALFTASALFLVDDRNEGHFEIPLCLSLLPTRLPFNLPYPGGYVKKMPKICIQKCILSFVQRQRRSNRPLVKWPHDLRD
jgi:hypothetical protein